LFIVVVIVIVGPNRNLTTSKAKRIWALAYSRPHY